MKALVLCALAVAVAADSTPKTYGPSLPAGQHSTQPAFSRSGSVDFSSNADYSNDYSVPDSYSGVDFDAQDSRFGGQTQGSFGTALHDGRGQNANYYSDGNSGYQADAQYYDVARHPSSRSSSYSHDNLYSGNRYPNRRIGSFSQGGLTNPGYETLAAPTFSQGMFMNPAFVPTSIGFRRGLGQLGFNRQSRFDFNHPGNFGFRGGMAQLYGGYGAGPARFARGLHYRRSPMMRQGYYH